MKKILRSHPNIIIGVLAIVLLSMMVLCYVWTIDNVFVALHIALMSPTADNPGGFDLSAASALDLRGLIGNPPPSATPTTATSTPAATGTPL